MMAVPEQEPITGREDASALSSSKAALVQFYRAFNSRDLALMSRNWAQIDAIVMDNPVGGIMRGWDEIRSVYERIFTGTAEIQVEFFDYTLHESPEIFYVVGRERGSCARVRRRSH